MRFATYEHDGAEWAGVVQDEIVHPLPEGVTVLGLIESGTLIEAGTAALGGTPVPLSDVRLLPPLRPPSRRGCLAEIWGRAGRQDPPPLSPGDVVTLTVEGIGTVTNTVVAGTDPVPVSAARARRHASRR